MKEVQYPFVLSSLEDVIDLYEYGTNFYIWYLTLTQKYFPLRVQYGTVCHRITNFSFRLSLLSVTGIKSQWTDSSSSSRLRGRYYTFRKLPQSCLVCLR